MTLKKKYTKEYDKYLSDGLRVWLNYFIELNHFPQTSSFCKRFTVTDFDTTDVIKCKKCFENYVLMKLRYTEVIVTLTLCFVT